MDAILIEGIQAFEQFHAVLHELNEKISSTMDAIEQFQCSFDKKLSDHHDSLMRMLKTLLEKLDENTNNTRAEMMSGDESDVDKTVDQKEAEINLEEEATIIDIFSGQIDSAKETPKVFDELPKSALTTAASYKLFADDLDVYQKLNSQEEETYYQDFGKSENGALKMLNKSTRLVFTGLKSFPEKLLVKSAYQVFDKTPQLSFVWPFEQLNGNQGFIPLIDCVPRVFDPGSVTIEFPFLIFFPRIDIEFCKVEISGLVFDPGGLGVLYGLFIPQADW